MERKTTKENVDWEWFRLFAGIEQAHNFYVYHIFSKVIDFNPRIHQIVELGTYTGAMSVCLGLEGIRKNIPVFSFDIADQRSDETKKLFDHLNVKFNVLDIWQQKDVIKDLIRTKPTYLICDNGNKRDEFTEFGRELMKGSVISAHDYGHEFFDEYAQGIADKISPFMQEDWTRHNCQMATWMIK